MSPKLPTFRAPAAGDEELSAKQIAFCQAYAGDPTAPTFGNALACARKLGLSQTHVYQWLKLTAVSTVIQAYLDRHKAWVDQVQAILQAAGLEAAGKLIDAVRATEGMRVHTPLTYAAEQKRVPLEDAQDLLPEFGSEAWERVERAVAAHNRNYIQLYKHALDEAKTIVAHTIGHPALKADVHHHTDRTEDSELAKEVRRLSPAAQEKLLAFVRGAGDLLEAPHSRPREIGPPAQEEGHDEDDQENAPPAP